MLDNEKQQLDEITPLLQEFQENFASLYKAGGGVIKAIADVARTELAKGGAMDMKNPAAISIVDPALMHLTSVMMQIDYIFMPKIERYLKDNGVDTDRAKAKATETKGDVH